VGSFKNLLLQNHWANFNQTWHKSSKEEEGLKFVQIKGIAPLQGEIIAKSKNTLIFLKPSSPEPAGQNQSNLKQIILR
jgi:hypothetical protein